MLSPGKYYQIIPRDKLENLQLRKAILEKARNNPGIQQGLLAMCAEDCLFFIALFCFQANPETMEEGPFIPWDYQEAAIIGGETEIGGRKVMQEGLLACVEDRKDVRWPKSRDGGASWVVLLVIVWLCLFSKKPIRAGAISRDEDAVDKLGDLDSLFEKIRHILKKLPDWMKGKALKNAKKGNIIFDNGNTVTGEANVASAKVGGRLSILLIDEFGQFDKNGEWIFDFTSDVSGCRVFVFTHKDQSGMAYQICYDAKFADMREIMTHWSQHPRKNRGLYRYNESSGAVDILDKTFNFNSICFHNLPLGKCRTCEQRGFRPFEFQMDVRPVGGPCPGIRSPWYDDETRGRNERDVKMNLDIDPRGGSDQFFDSYTISILKAEFCRPPVWVGDLEYDKVRGQPKRLRLNPKGSIRLWRMPKSDTEFPKILCGGGIDISAGSGASPSCISLWDAESGEKFMEYSRNDIFQQDLAVFAAAFCRMIKDHNGTHPLLTWEAQFSQAFTQRMREIGYGPIYIARNEDKFGRPRKGDGSIGVNTGRGQTKLRFEKYRDALYERRCINPSADALDEALNFVYTANNEGVVYKGKGKVKEDGAGARIHHGDMPVADTLGFLMITELGFEHPDEAVIQEKWPDPRTFDGRVALAEQREREQQWEDEEIYS